MTADFTRWSRSGRSGFVASLAAFPFGNAVALVVGGVIVALGAAQDPGEQGGNFLAILIAHGGVLVPLAVAFVFVNLGSVCAHCLYNGAVGWSQLTHRRMRALTVVLGAIGIVLAVAGIWSYFEQWLNLLGVVVPPIGTVLILDLLVLPRVLGARPTASSAWRAAPFVAWALGSVAALLTHLLAAWLSDAVVGIVVTAVVYTAISASSARRSASEAVEVRSALVSSNGRSGRS